MQPEEEEHENRANRRANRKWMNAGKRIRKTGQERRDDEKHSNINSHWQAAMGSFNTDEKKSNIRQYSIKFRSKSCEETIIFAKAKKTYGTGC